MYHIIRSQRAQRATRLRRNDDNMSNNKNNARVKNNHFTIAQLARENDINPKIARRRMRDAIKRNDDRVVKSRQRDIEKDDMRVRHEFPERYRDRILSIIKND